MEFKNYQTIQISIVLIASFVILGLILVKTYTQTPSTIPEIKEDTSTIENMEQVEEIEEGSPQYNVFQTHPNTVKDYLMQIDDKYFMGFTAEERTKGMTILDEENYYTAFDPIEIDGNGSMTIFITPEGENIVAIETKVCGPACYQEFHILAIWKKDMRDKTTYTEITERAFPELDFTKEMNDAKAKNPDAPFIPLITLPQHGTTIEIREQFSHELLATVKWKKGKFVKITP